MVGCKQDLLDYVRHLTTTARVWPDYEFDEVGFNYRMTNIQAAVGVAQMERLDRFVETKRKVRRYYVERLGQILSEGMGFFPTTNGSSCWFSGIVFQEGTDLAKVKEICAELREKEIEARPFWKPVHLQVPYRNCPKSKLAVAESLWQRILTQPCSTNITEEELDSVVAMVKLQLFR